jgi:eukaryotic-like serine/threonine-protein kinase
MLNIRKMKLFYFLTQKKFYLHFGIAMVVGFLLLLLAFRIQKSYTYFGEAITVPDYSGSSFTKLDSIEDLNNFTFIVSDSVFDPNKASGTVVAQNPLPFSKVKRNRKIYLTVVAQVAEMVKMPNLVDLSLRQSLDRLEMAGLKVNNLIYIPDFARDAVLTQMYQGDTIYPDSLIQINSRIDVILGKGYDSKPLITPFLIGLSKDEAEKKIYSSTFNLGEETYLEEGDPDHMKVYLQDPSWNDEIQLNRGDFINLWYRSDIGFDFEEYIYSITTDTLSVDSLHIDPLNFDPLLDTLNF